MTTATRTPAAALKARHAAARNPANRAAYAEPTDPAYRAAAAAADATEAAYRAAFIEKGRAIAAAEAAWAEADDMADAARAAYLANPAGSLKVRRAAERAASAAHELDNLSAAAHEAERAANRANIDAHAAACGWDR